jgi:AP-4 complex subunit epsilon-1
MSSSSASTTPKDFFELVKAIGESKSKQEEDRIVTDEVQYLKKTIAQPGTSKKKMKELVVRSLYVEMLGQDASFAYIKAVELCASTSIVQKRVGYLAASLCLSPDHEFRFMLVNQIQRDMKSSNVLEVCAALSAVCKIITEDMIPAVIGEIVKLFTHEMESVRKKSLGAIHRLYQMDRGCVEDHLGKIRRALCDKDPCVMGASLPLLQALIQDDVSKFKDLVPSFVSILKQIMEHRLPRDYDYHRIPSPWIQMNLLKILAILGKGDQTSSEGMYEVLADVMKRADTGINVGYAIVYETVKTITTIYPNTVLLEAAATAISRFIRSESHNLKYIGVKGLASIVKDFPKYAADHQMAVIDCLEDPDETLKRKTLDLLFQMTNAVNVEFIVDKLLFFLASATDDHFRTALVGQITQCAERFAPSNAWYVQTVIKVFELAGDKVKVSVAQTLMQLIAEGTELDDDEEEDDDDGNEALRSEAVEHFLQLVEMPKLPAILSQAIAWVLGEYGYLSQSATKEVVMDKLCQLFQKSAECSETRAHIITALMKLVAQNGSCPSKVVKLIGKFRHSQSLDLQQRCFEFLHMIEHSSTMVDVLPVDASCEDIEVDEDLSFLNGYVQCALDMGASPYCPPADFDPDEDLSNKKSGLNYTPYEMPTIPAPTPALALVGGLGGGSDGSTAASSSSSGPSTSFGNASMGLAQRQTPVGGTSQGNQVISNRSTSQVWGKKIDVPVTPEQGTPPPTSPSVTDSHQSSGGLSSSTSSDSYKSQSYMGAAPQEGSGTSLAPAAPKEKSEREKQKEEMASALFGGMSAASSGRRPKTKKSTSSSSAAGLTLSPSPEVAVQSPVMLSPSAGSWGAPPPAFASPSSPTSPAMRPQQAVTSPVNNPAPPASLFDMDLLDMPAPAHHSASVGNGNSNGSMMMGGSVSLPQPPAIAMSSSSAEVNSPASSISDVFSNMDLNMSGGAPSSQAASSLRPLNIPTNEFGRRWGSTQCESKVSVRCNVRTLPQLQGCMPQHLHHIESISNTQEAIFAASVTSIGSIILVHVKLYSLKGTCDVTVKSTSKELCDHELETISSALN